MFAIVETPIARFDVGANEGRGERSTGAPKKRTPGDPYR
jgi:hypothetical protein